MTPDQREKAVADWDAAQKAVNAAREDLADAEYDGDQSEIHDGKVAVSRAEDQLREVLQRFPEIRHWPK